MKYEGLKVIEERVKVSVETILKPSFEIIENPLITDLHVNADGTIYTKGIDGNRRKVDLCFENRDIETVAALLASSTNNDASASSPVVPAAWDNPALRFQIFLPPVVDAPAISIRKFLALVSDGFFSFFINLSSMLFFDLILLWIL